MHKLCIKKNLFTTTIQTPEENAFNFFFICIEIFVTVFFSLCRFVRRYWSEICATKCVLFSIANNRFRIEIINSRTSKKKNRKINQKKRVLRNSVVHVIIFFRCTHTWKKYLLHFTYVLRRSLCKQEVITDDRYWHFFSSSSSYTVRYYCRFRIAECVVQWVKMFICHQRRHRCRRHIWKESCVFISSVQVFHGEEIGNISSPSWPIFPQTSSHKYVQTGEFYV